MDAAALRLSAIIDAMARGTGSPDAAFVRSFARWLHDQGAHFALEPIERLGLRDVVVTFTITNRVRLVATGHLPGDLPGDVTLRIDETDFPEVVVLVSSARRADPYDVCTMDYTLAGARLRAARGPHAGRTGTLRVAATIGDRQRHRVLFDGDRDEVDLDGEDLAPHE